MDGALRRAVGAHLGGEVAAVLPASGGCINRAAVVELADGGRRFVKWNAAAPSGMFEREAEGLAALAAPGAIRVPADPRPGGAGGVAFLTMEAIGEGRPGPGFWEDFGRRFAALHRETTSPRCGFDHDNYLGSTLQPNGWYEDWVEFFRDRRLGHQLTLAAESGLADGELLRLGERVLERLEELLAVPGEPCCLLHGDLWGGNFLVDAAGEAVLVDPAAYYGHREADLAMTRLFGGFEGRFYSAYEEIWALGDGWRERLPLYQLYHLLNHLNLFGVGYRGQCMEVLRRYA